MKELLRQSKKFRAAVITAAVNLLLVLTSKLAVPMDEELLHNLMNWLFGLGIAYMGAEGISEMKAKAVVEENKVRKEISNSVVEKLTNASKEETK